MNIRTTTATGLAALALALTGCSALTEQSVPADDLEQGVAKLLEEQVGQPVESVECEDDLAAEPDSEVRCQLEATDGTTIGLTVTATSVDGDEVNYEINVDEEPTDDQPADGSTGPTPEPSGG